MNGMGSLRVENLRWSWPGFELRADFEVRPGERILLSGRSGSGKTSLLRILSGLEPASGDASGRILLGGQEIQGWAPERRKIGLVFQDQGLLSAWDAVDNATLGWKVRGVSRTERESRIFPILEAWGLRESVSTPVTRWSGGEKQRLALIRAWVWKPALILQDEPFSALDVETQSRVMTQLLAWHQESPVPLIHVSHDESEGAPWVTGRIILKESGSVRSFVRE